MVARQQRFTPQTVPGEGHETTGNGRPLRNQPKGTGKSGNPAARKYDAVRPARFRDWVGGADRNRDQNDCVQDQAGSGWSVVRCREALPFVCER